MCKQRTYCVRLTVKRWDEAHIHGTTAAGEEVCMSYGHAMPGYARGTWTYLREFLAEGCQLNLVQPHVEGNVLVPELIVFEPDYLINISEIAACFQPYAASHLCHLIRKLQPAAQSEAILLGNLASQLLDEEMHTDSTRQPYAESVKKFFKGNAFSLLATHISPAFHTEAQAQKRNIHHSFTALPQLVREFDRSQVILEPSFLSPMLGLQGRVDLMQQDFRFLVEQKSGKSQFPYPTRADECPRPIEAHYIQLLLYMMVMRYNYRAVYERNGGHFQAFLLYSKYPQSLCAVDFSPEQMYHAMRVRNSIAWADAQYACKGGFAVLDTLTPESLRQRDVSDKLWDGYLRPQFAKVLDPIHRATPLERAYFHRMMTFIAQEHRLAKIGNGQPEDGGQAAIWLTSVEEKRQTGNIFTDLCILRLKRNQWGAVEDIVLTFEARPDNGMCNFRKGDVVILYPYLQDTCPDATCQIINRCAITDLTAETLTLHLRFPQSSDRLFAVQEGTLWAVEHDFMEASYTSLYRGMTAFLSTTQERKNLLLMQRLPRHDETRRLNGTYGAFDELSLRMKQAQDIFLIIGPPGTGKTSYGMLNTLMEELTEPGSNILVASYTNRAVDEICSKLVVEGIDFLRLGSAVSCDEAYHSYLIDKKVDECSNLVELEATVERTRVIVGTTTALSSHTALFQLKRFDLLIVDEASQILEPHLLPILSALHQGEAAVRKMVMIGDHKQLPAVVKQTPSESQVTDPALNAIGLKDCRLSLFERLLARYGQDPHVAYMLTRQGRMHRDIAAFPNEAFYEGRLQVVPLPHQLATTEALRLTFVAVQPPSQDQWVSDKINQPEAEVIARKAVDIYLSDPQRFSPQETIGIIVPYRNQIATIRNAIARHGIAALHDIAIDTVERYQGSQRDHIIYGFTVQKPYQLEFLTSTSFVENGHAIDRKLNVAMTRAREHLFLVGNPAVLYHDTTFRRLIDYVKQHNGYYETTPNNDKQ